MARITHEIRVDFDPPTICFGCLFPTSICICGAGATPELQAELERMAREAAGLWTDERGVMLHVLWEVMQLLIHRHLKEIAARGPVARENTPAPVDEVAWEDVEE